MSLTSGQQLAAIGHLQADGAGGVDIEFDRAVGLTMITIVGIDPLQLQGTPSRSHPQPWRAQQRRRRDRTAQGARE